MSTPHEIAARAIANAEAFVRYQKDASATNKDAQYDFRALLASPIGSRFERAIYLLVRSTILATEGDLTPAVQLALLGSAQWVAEAAGIAAADDFGARALNAARHIA